MAPRKARETGTIIPHPRQSRVKSGEAGSLTRVIADEIFKFNKLMLPGSGCIKPQFERQLNAACS